MGLRTRGSTLLDRIVPATIVVWPRRLTILTAVIVILACWPTFDSRQATLLAQQEAETARDGKTAASDRIVEAAARDASPTYMGRTIAVTMSYHGANWLTRQERQREEQPAKLLKALQLKPGQSVCDFGCGNGYYTLRLANLVGPLGKVYAVDIQAEMLELLKQRAEPRGLSNIDLVLSEQDDPGLPDDTLDLVLMVDVYHELSDPPPVLAAVIRSLRPSGRLAVVEFREEDPQVPIRPLHKMNQLQVVKELTANGFKLTGQYDGLPWQHVLFFSRGDSPLPAAQLIPWDSATQRRRD